MPSFSEAKKHSDFQVTLCRAAMFAFPTAAWSQTAEWTVYNTANSGMLYNRVTCIAIDAQGNI